MSVNSRCHAALSRLFAGALGLILASSAQAQVYSPLATLSTNQGGNGIANPVSQIVTQGKDGDLYFTSVSGGFYGTFFKASPKGTVVVVNKIGYFPNGGATLGSDGYYYLTNSDGGNAGYGCGFSGCGQIVKVSSAGKETVLYSFLGQGDGSSPTSAPIQATNGLFYGTASSDGDSDNEGTAYSITSKGVFTLLHKFDANTEGYQINAGLVQGSDGNFYGTTVYGGTNGDGTIFKMTPTGAVTVLHTFAGPEGAHGSFALIQASNGNFFGVATSGGEYGSGVVYQITASGEYNVLHNFAAGDGYGPGSTLTIGSDGKLYGVTSSGGGGYAGSLYSLTTSGSFTTLYTFCQSGTCTDGYGPNTQLQQNTNGVFYGATNTGGDLSCGNGVGCGLVYSLNMGLPPFIKLLQTSALEGAIVGVFGQQFDATTTVEFGGTKALKVTRSGSTYLSATVPPGALTGPVTITTDSTTLTAIQPFSVLPAVKSISPTSGAVGIPVTIMGSGFDQATGVTFNGDSASFTIVSDTEITTTVPSAATTGAITVTTQGGTVTSKTIFKVK